MDQPAITGRFSSRTSVDTVPKPNKGGLPHQFPPDVSGGEGVLKKIGLTCVLSAFLIGCASLVRELLSSQNIRGRLWNGDVRVDPRRVRNAFARWHRLTTTG